MKIEGIHTYEVSKCVKCLNRTAPQQFHEWFKFNYERHGHRTRSNFNINDGATIKNLFVLSARITNYGLKQLKLNSPRIWNNHPVS